MDEIYDYELGMWNAAKNRDSEKFLEYVSESAIMVCGGFRCSGADYASVVAEFDCSVFSISEFEVVYSSEFSKQVHYIIRTVAADKENADLSGAFHITSTWVRSGEKWKLIFNMDSRILEM